MTEDSSNFRVEGIIITYYFKQTHKKTINQIFILIRFT